MASQTRISTNKSTQTQSGEDLNKFIRASQYSLEDQLNRGTTVETVTDRMGKGKSGDIAHRATSDGIQLMMKDGKGGSKEIRLSKGVSGLKARQSGTTAPTVADNFPNNGQFGFYLNTATGLLYYPTNVDGTLMNVGLSTLAGSLGTGQHGNLSAEVATMHAFTQISGTITDTQHGDRSTTVTTMHAFAQIAGTITLAQHGNMAAGTSAHQLAGSGTNGFMSSTHYDTVQSANVGSTAGSLVLRDSNGDIKTADKLYVHNVQVLGNQETGWTAMTNTANKASSYDTTTVTLPQLAARVKSIQDALMTHGLIT